MKKKVILYDFDKTIIDSESIFLLWKFAIKKHPYLFITLIINLCREYIYYLLTGNFCHVKKAMVSVMKPLREKDLEDFFLKILYPSHFFEEVFPEFEKYGDGDIKILCSASCENYLKYINKILPFDYILGTKLDENYKVLGENNSGKEKVRRIKKLLERENIEIDYENSLAYTDSYKNDKYMASLVKNRFLINSKKHFEDFTNLSWHTRAD